MTNKISIKASEVRVEDHVYSGTGATARPTFAWETVTQIKNEDGLILLITGDLRGLHGEFWLEPDEEITVLRYPQAAPVQKVLPKSHHKPAH